MPHDRQQRVAVITGAGAGIGASVATELARTGTAVALLDVSGDAVAARCAEIEGAGGRAVAHQVDVRDAVQVQRAISSVALSFGGIDYLASCAGVARYGTVVDMSERDWDLQIDTNLKGAFLLCKYGIPELRKRDGGAIVMISSAQAFASQQLVAAYAASKGGLVSLTKTIALDHASEGIRCNCLCPGSIDTPMLRAGAAQFGGEDADETLRAWGRRHPLGFVGQPHDVADAAVFLLGEHARFITGATLAIDGGLLAQLSV